MKTKEILKYQPEIERVAKEHGLDFDPVVFEVVDYDTISRLAAYGGFPVRYPHWRFGMEYDHLSKGYRYGLQKIYEMVINTNPVYAYLMKSNSIVDQKLVMAHVFGHADFFKNNYFFSQTNKKMIDEMANHASKVKKYIDRFGLETVEDFIDVCLSIENLIDVYSMFIERSDNSKKELSDDEPITDVKKLKSKKYMDDWINPKEFLEKRKEFLKKKAQKEEHFPRRPERDVMGFLMKYAPLRPWQADILSIIRKESYYFAPQAMTKIMNEGWACLVGNSRINTKNGLIKIEDIVNNKLKTNVFDGTNYQPVSNWIYNTYKKRIKIITKAGYELFGGYNHRILLNNRWVKLKDLQIGHKIHINKYNLDWTDKYVDLKFELPIRKDLFSLSKKYNTTYWTVRRYKNGRNVEKKDKCNRVLGEYNSQNDNVFRQIKKIKMPEIIDEDFATLLGFLVGDGNTNESGLHNLTTGDDEVKEIYIKIYKKLFGIYPSNKKDGNRWRISSWNKSVYSILQYLGIKEGKSAEKKSIPEVIFRSPKSVVISFIRAYFDADGHAAKNGDVILISKSNQLSKEIQEMLLGFNIYSTISKQNDGCYRLRISGIDAFYFYKYIGFNLHRKQQRLENLHSNKKYKKKKYETEIVKIIEDQGPTYDISVENTHKYFHNGFINHNCYWHSKLMTNHILGFDEVVDYAQHHSGTVAMHPGRLNPYRIGYLLFQDIEDRWNKGRFGKEWEDEKNMDKLEKWDMKLGQGLDKIFEVRKIYNDLTFIDTFLTKDFVEENKLFAYNYDKSKGIFRISSKEFQKIKQSLVSQLTNRGQPVIEVKDANWNNANELLLSHKYEGTVLDPEYADATLKNIYKLWKRPVGIETCWKMEHIIYKFDGKQVKIV